MFFLLASVVFQPLIDSPTARRSKSGTNQQSRTRPVAPMRRRNTPQDGASPPAATSRGGLAIRSSLLDGALRHQASARSDPHLQRQPERLSAVPQGDDHR